MSIDINLLMKFDPNHYHHLLYFHNYNYNYSSQEGSVVAIYGMGKLEVKSIQETSKGRFKVKIIKTT